MKLVLKRFFGDETQTLGILSVIADNGLCCKVFSTLELPYLNNLRNISSIPEGDYMIRPRYSYKFGDHLELLGVPKRDAILLHHGNYKQDTRGCILIGMKHTDLNGDGNLDVEQSRKALKELLNFMGNETTTIMIINNYNVGRY